MVTPPPHHERIHSPLMRVRRSPLLNAAVLIGVIGLVILVVLLWILPAEPTVHHDVIDFSQSIEQIEELSTVRSHFRFAVVVREESGNIIVRRLAEMPGELGMNGLGSALFEDPTMIVELHGVATYGMDLRGLQDRIRQNDSTVTIPLPSARVLDVKLVAADTKVVARMKGLFRSPNNELLQVANQRGEAFIGDYARQDSASLALAAARARDLLGMLVDRGGLTPRFE